MELLFVSFVAGVLTLLAPCVLPLLPVIVGGSVQDVKDKSRPFIIAAALALSIIAFTLVLRASTVFIEVPAMVWQWLSGGLILLIGVFMIIPEAWERLAAKLTLNTRSNQLLGTSFQKKGWAGPILIGAALGPVFLSCSPTYAIVLATVLPQSFINGLVLLVAYAVGLCGGLLIIAFAGQRLIAKLAWASDPKGWFKRGLGIVFILVGLAVITGLDKSLQTYLIDRGVYDGISEFELQFHD